MRIFFSARPVALALKPQAKIGYGTQSGATHYTPINLSYCVAASVSAYATLVC